MDLGSTSKSSPYSFGLDYDSLGTSPSAATPASGSGGFMDFLGSIFSGGGGSGGGGVGSFLGQLLPSMVQGGSMFLMQKGKSKDDEKLLQQKMSFEAEQNRLQREMQLAMAAKQLQAAMAQVGAQVKIAKMNQLGNAFESLRNAYLAGSANTAGSINNMTQNIQKGLD